MYTCHRCKLTPENYENPPINSSEERIYEHNTIMFDLTYCSNMNIEILAPTLERIIRQICPFGISEMSVSIGCDDISMHIYDKEDERKSYEELFSKNYRFIDPANQDIDSLSKILNRSLIAIDSCKSYLLLRMATNK